MKQSTGCSTLSITLVATGTLLRACFLRSAARLPSRFDSPLVVYATSRISSGGGSNCVGRERNAQPSDDCVAVDSDSSSSSSPFFSICTRMSM